MTITWFFLLQVVVSLGLVFYRDHLRGATEHLDQLTWNACVNPGGNQ